MGWIGDSLESIRSIHIRQVLTQAVSLGMIVTSALIIWKGLMCVTGSESPVVVVLSGSMEPGFKRGDILFLHMSKEPIRAGEIVVFNIDGREIPIVHRVIKVHERQDTGEVDVLTKVFYLNKLINDESRFFPPYSRFFSPCCLLGFPSGFGGFLLFPEKFCWASRAGCLGRWFAPSVPSRLLFPVAFLPLFPVPNLEAAVWWLLGYCLEGLLAFHFLILIRIKCRFWGDVWLPSFAYKYKMFV
ncbi:hypothetical protein IEQ34_004259 [Dendrobium chrysotoxum]|uniref:Signal peptidase complex catalytic subunit SEC11 n=1 Tax=Dendrobium chrysotoxum TaxID=161865 RepID=A0AAV7HDK0_DENCH|nr:hypothetical protein IEQ34_004259 [Dendrobium chrysotoxum]